MENSIFKRNTEITRNPISTHPGIEININDRVELETIDGSPPIKGSVVSFEFDKIHILCNEYPTVPYSFDPNKVKLLKEKL